MCILEGCPPPYSYLPISDSTKASGVEDKVFMREAEKNRKGVSMGMTTKNKILLWHHPLFSKTSSRKILTAGTFPKPDLLVTGPLFSPP